MDQGFGGGGGESGVGLEWNKHRELSDSAGKSRVQLSDRAPTASSRWLLFHSFQSVNVESSDLWNKRGMEKGSKSHVVAM